MKKEPVNFCKREPEIPGLIRYLNKQLDLLFNANLGKCGLTNQQGRIVLFIHCRAYKCQDVVYQSDIEEHLKLSKSTVSGLINRLINNNFIQKGNEVDSRALVLTEKGLETVSLFRQAQDATREQLLKGYSEDQRKQIKQTIRQMIENVEEMKK